MSLSRLGREMKTRREQLGLSRADVARKIGVSSQTIDNWEEGRNTPHARKHGYITEALQWQLGSVARVLEGADPIALLDGVPQYPDIEDPSALVAGLEYQEVQILQQFAALLQAGREEVRTRSVVVHVEDPDGTLHGLAGHRVTSGGEYTELHVRHDRRCRVFVPGDGGECFQLPYDLEGCE